MFYLRESVSRCRPNLCIYVLDECLPDFLHQSLSSDGLGISSKLTSNVQYAASKVWYQREGAYPIRF